MSLALPERTRLSLTGLLLAVVALTMQLAAASVVPFASPILGVDRLLAASICHADDAADHGGAPARHHAPDCAVCPLCQAISHAGALLVAPAAGFAVPMLLVARVFVLPLSHAPPGRAASAASARGPPATL
jgi:hypothetical protein